MKSDPTTNGIIYWHLKPNLSAHYLSSSFILWKFIIEQYEIAAVLYLQHMYATLSMCSRKDNR